MANKIKYGLRNVHYAVLENGSYGTPVAWPGAVKLTLNREGNDSSDFYADDGIYYSFGATNGGYSGDLEMAYLPDSVAEALLSEITGNGGQYELSSAEPKEFALLCEMQGDDKNIGFVFYGCKMSRPNTEANTKGEQAGVDTQTANIRISGHDFTVNGQTERVIRFKKENVTSSFFATVQTPTNLSA